MTTVPQVEANTPAAHRNRAGPDSSTREPPKISLEQKELERKTRAARIATGVGLGTAFGIGLAMKDGFKTGLNRIAHSVSTFSTLLSPIAALVFLPLTLANEFFALRNVKPSKHDPNKAIYSIFSLIFAHVTFSTPMAMATRSKGHMFAGLLNSVHTLFTFFSYTGGRFMSTLKACQIKLNKDETQRYRLEQEFESLFKLGNLGSAQAAVIPMAGQFILGWQTIRDVFRGRFSDASERFKKEPMSVGFGVLANAFIWPFEFFAKIFDTTVRTAEMAPRFENASIGGHKSIVIKALNGFKNKWYKWTNDPDSSWGGFLRFGRAFSKAWSLVGPPVGMASVVVPTTQKFLKGEFWNKEAQEMGGVVGFADKVFNTLSFFSHIYYTGVYALFVRLPQTITSSTFYICEFINRRRGIDTNTPGYDKNPRYLDPVKVRDRIFNRPWINAISDWAERMLQKCDAEVNGKNGRTIDENKESRFLRTLPVTIAQEVCWEPIREAHYKKLVYSGEYGEEGVKPPQIEWEDYLKKHKTEILNEVEVTLEKYLRESCLFDDEKIAYCKSKSDWKDILKECENLLDQEATASKRAIAQKVYWEEVRETHFNQILQDEKNSKNDKMSTQSRWKSYLQNNKQLIMHDAEVAVEKNLRKGKSKDEGDKKIKYYKSKGILSDIKEEIENLINAEIIASKEEFEKSTAKVKIKSEDFWELLKNPRELWEVIKSRTFHIENTLLPLFIRGFVNIVDFGKNDEPFWYRNWKAQEQGLREGDYERACNNEYMPVVSFALSKVGHGLAIITNLFRGKLPEMPEEIGLAHG